MSRRVDLEIGHDRPTGFARWILPALIVSFLLHALLVWWAKDRVVMGMSSSFYDAIVPRTFRIERAEIDPKLLDPEPAQERAKAAAPVPVRLPEEKVSFEKMMGDVPGAAAMPEIPALDSKPAMPSTDFSSAVDAAKASGARSLLEDSRALQEALLAETPAQGKADSSSRPLMPEIGGGALVPAGESRGGNAPGFSNLDELLASTGPLSPETAPILMPTDLLFDYDAADLRPAAIESLAKLGELIRRNPGSAFIIEGHTDSYGPDDYNLALSARRAETVKNWLAANMSIDPSAVSTVGYGKRRLIAPASGTVEEQQINRRVEIVIRPRKTSAAQRP